MQPVTETKCGPWLHWHRGQSSSHTHTHTHTDGYAAVRKRDRPRQMQEDAGPRHDSAYPDRPATSNKLMNLAAHHQATDTVFIAIWYNLASLRVAHYASPQRRCDRPQQDRRRRRGLSRALTEAGGQPLFLIPYVPWKGLRRFPVTGLGTPMLELLCHQPANQPAGRPGSLRTQYRNYSAHTGNSNNAQISC